MQRITFFLGILLFVLSLSMPQTWAQKSGVSPNVLVLPKGPGSIGGVGENVRPNLNMGLMSYSIAIEVPPGRGGATPALGVTYSSAAGAGLMGIGWNFQAEDSVRRLTVRGLPTYTNDDRFYAGGELVKIPNTSFYRARVEGGFVRYQWLQKDANDQQGYWVAEAPDGTKSYYGADEKGSLHADSQITGLDGTYEWKLVVRVDRNGNRIQYSYFKDGSQSYLDQISWVFDAQNNPLYQVKLVYENRPDPISDGKPGFDLQIKKRIKEIQVTSAGQRFRSYQFTFEDQTGLSRLIKVERFGRDGKGLYPVVFTMKYSDSTFSPQNSRMVKMPTSLGLNFANSNAAFLDVNGDGLPDVVNTENPKHVFYINQLTVKGIAQDQHDYPNSARVENPDVTSAKLSTSSVQLMDFNGDGFTDLVDATNKKIYLNKGNTKWEAGADQLQNFPITNADPNIRFFDYNGDKATDIIRSDGTSTSYWVNDKKGGWTNITGKDNIGRSFDKDMLRLIDINGDGLMDVVHITSSSLRYRKYLGYGKWSAWIDMQVPGIDKYPLSTKAQFADINGDGMSDMVAFLGTSIVYFVNKNGMEFAAGQQLQAFNGVDIPDSTQATVQIADMNGNGSRDIIWIDSSGSVTYLELFNKRPNLMTEISNGIGQRINVEYGSSVNFFLRDKSCNPQQDKACVGPWQNKLPMAFPVVTKITTWASRVASPDQQAQPTAEARPQVQSIYYHNGFYDGVEKKFRGFRHVETLYDGDPAMGERKDEVKFDVGDTDTYFHGKLLEQVISDGAQKIYRHVKYTWNDCPVELGATQGKSLNPPVRFICQQAVETDVIEGMPNAKKTLRQEVTYDGYGNVTVDANLGEKGKDGDEQVTRSTYIVPKDPNDKNAVWLLRFPQKMEYCSATTGGTCAVLEYFYDGEALKGLPAGQITNGNVTRTRVLVEAGKNDTVEPQRSGYDKYGNIIESLTATGQRRTYVWDKVYNRFPTEETIHMQGYQMILKTTWDYAYSRVAESVDLNGQTTRYTYDNFGRLTQVFQPGDANDKPSAQYSYELKAPLSRIVGSFRSTQGGAADHKVIQCFDGLGRRISILRQVKAGQFLVLGHQEYTREGQRAQLWNTYESDETCKFVAPGGTPSSQYFYDGLRRLVKQTYPDGAVSRLVIEPFQLKVYDQEDNKAGSPHFDTPTIQITDGLDRIIEEQKMPAKGKTITTKFAYTNVLIGGVSKITTVTFADGSQKTHEYDLRGNILKTSDPDRGVTTYTYNPDRLIASKTDALGIKLLYTYDGLQRLLSFEQEGKPDTKITYQYDQVHSDLKTATFTNGRVVRIQYPNGALLYSYDVRGNQIVERRNLLGVNFDFQRTYNNINQLQKLTYPNQTALDFQRDGYGRVAEIPGKIKQVTYHKDGMLASWTANNDVATTMTYNKLYRVTQVDVGAGNVLTMKYQYDANGNIVSWEQKHGATSFTNTYQYDALYRLTQASMGAGSEVLTFQQDDMSNLTSKLSSLGQKSVANLGEYVYSKGHVATQIGAMKPQYDKIGQTLQLAGFTHQWDFLGRRTQTSQNGNVAGRYWYNHAYERIIKEENGLHTFYINRQYEIREGAVVSYIWMQNDRKVATWSVKGVDTFFDDLAPATGDTQLQPGPDGAITAGDAWLYHAGKNKLVTIALKQRPLDLDLTKDMLQASLQRLLLGPDQAVNYFYHSDHLGSVRAVTDDSGAVVQRKHYYPYGAVRQQTGDTQLFVHGYQGTELDPLTNTNFFGVRSLLPTAGRWLSPDPAFTDVTGTSDEFNSYGMVMNNPIRMRDLQGTSSVDTSQANTATLSIAAGVGGGIGLLVVTGLAAVVYKNSFSPAANESNQKPRGILKAGGLKEARNEFASRYGIDFKQLDLSKDADWQQAKALMKAKLAQLSPQANTSVNQQGGHRRSSSAPGSLPRGSVVGGVNSASGMMNFGQPTRNFRSGSVVGGVNQFSGLMDFGSGGGGHRRSSSAPGSGSKSGGKGYKIVRKRRRSGSK